MIFAPREPSPVVQSPAHDTAVYVRMYFQEAHCQTIRDRDPVPLVGQMLNKPNQRIQLGPLMVAALLSLQRSGDSAAGTSAAARSPEVIGKEVFAALEPYREGPEKTIPPTAARELGELSLSNDHPLVRLSRLAVEGLRVEYPQAAGIAAEAMLASHVYVTSQQQDSAA